MLWWKLRKLKQSSDPDGRARVVRELGATRNSRVVPALLKALDDDESIVRLAALEALGSVDWQPQDSMQRAIKAVAHRRWADVRGMGPVAVRPLAIALTSWKPALRGEALGALLTISATDRMALPAEVVDLLLDATRSPDANFARDAVMMLGRVRDERCMQRFIAALSHDDRHVRAAAAEALGEVGDQRAVEPLLRALRDSYDHVRFRAAVALGSIRDPRAVDPLIASLQDSYLFIVATDALAKIGDARAVDPLRQYLTDHDHSKRERVAKALRLLKWQPSEITERARLAVERREWDEAVGVGSPSAEFLIAALQIGDSDIYKPAAEALGRIGDERSVLPLIVLARENMYAAETAIRALRNVLQRSLPRVSVDDLRAVAHLVKIYKPAGWQWHEDGTDAAEELDCSAVREFAKQELRRRGVPE